MNARTTARRSLPYAASVGLVLVTLAAPAALSRAATDAVYLGGTGTGTGLPELLGTGGDGSSFARTFVPDLDQRTDVIYNGSPVANPHDAVPLALKAVAAQNDRTAVIGLSKGAQVARATEQQDTRTDTRYVLVGDPDDDHGVSRTFGLSAPKQEFTHDVDIVVAEYDGVGDMPDRPGNLLATANALAGWAFVHPHYGAGGEDDPLERLDEAEVTQTRNPNGTTTTRHLIPTRELPLLKPLRDTERTLTGQDRITDEIEKPLRKVVDQGYSRNDAKPADRPATSTESDSDRKPAKADRDDRAGDAS